MPFDSNGTYNRIRSWVSDAAAGIKIRSDYHDNHDTDMAAALSTCITKDGRTQPTANIPMNQKKIVNLAEPGAPADAATKNYVDNFKAFATGLTVTGANYPSGMVHFGSPTGVTGLSWVNADMSWVGKVAEAGKWRQRLCVTNDAQGLGTELVTIDKGGVMGLSNAITNNLSYDGSSWRVNKIGIGSYLSYSNGTLTMSSNDTATLQDNQVTTLQPFWVLGQTSMTQQSNSHCYWQMQKKASGNTNTLRGFTGYTAAGLRWNLELGNGTAETGTAYVGSNFALTAYNNTGGGAKTMMYIDRSTNKVTFYGDVYSSTTTFASTTTTAILSSATVNGAVYLRPNGPDSSTEQCYVNNAGDWHISGGNLIIDANTTKGSYLGMGQQGRNGTTGGYTGYWHNWVYSSGELYALVNSTNLGMVSTPCDYRIKRNIKPMMSMWEKVKSLKPVTFNRKKFRDLTEDDEIEHWGFIAHELQRDLTVRAATFDKDAEYAIQSPNLLVVVAALTKALQEAMQRIETLEAKA